MNPLFDHLSLLFRQLERQLEHEKRVRTDCDESGVDHRNMEYELWLDQQEKQREVKS